MSCMSLKSLKHVRPSSISFLFHFLSHSLLLVTAGLLLARREREMVDLAREEGPSAPGWLGGGTCLWVLLEGWHSELLMLAVSP